MEVERVTDIGRYLRKIYAFKKNLKLSILHTVQYGYCLT